MSRQASDPLTASANAEVALESVRASLEEVAALAVSPTPEALDRAAGLLHSAIASLNGLRAALSPTGPNPRQLLELQRIRRAIAKAAALTHNGSRYYSGWSAWLGVRTNGYRAGGQPAPLHRPGRLSVQG